MLPHLLWALVGLTFGVAIQWLTVAVGSQNPHTLYRILTVVLLLMYAGAVIAILVGTPPTVHALQSVVAAWSATTALNLTACVVVYYQNRANLYRR